MGHLSLKHLSPWETAFHLHDDTDDTLDLYFWPQIFSFLDTTFLRRPTSIVRYGCHIGYAGNFKTCSVESSYSRVTTRPGPFTLTSKFLTPYSSAALPACSAATCAANGVLLREPLNPTPPDVAQERAFPWRSEIVTIVLLKEAWICATPQQHFLTFYEFLMKALPLISLFKKYIRNNFITLHLSLYVALFWFEHWF